MRRLSPIALLLILSLLAPLVGPLSFVPAAHAQARTVRAKTDKMTDSLRTLANETAPDSDQRTRVIVSLAGGPSKLPRAALEHMSANVLQQLNNVGMLVADVPNARLAELAHRPEVAWLSEDAEVRSLAVPDNTSHVEVTTGANQVLPTGNENVANGGAGNGVGIAVLDSGISPMDSAEFAGYQWQYGLLGLTRSLATYNRIQTAVDFTGEGSTVDTNGHGTHTAGIAA
ncbi:MAG TPA: hypothetical protein VF525_16910, partial [Pyrinomonadaceae bacterium]